jgi:enoyl-[acyl-carrier-protein] reductase (NADH)
MTADFPEAVFTTVAAHTPLKRAAESEDVADAAIWLCTDEARFVTGPSILVDGGYNIGGAR